MRTKNKKWIGPVPIAAVAALALAAFISAGLLLAPSGITPAAADDDPDCVVKNTGPSNDGGPDTPDLETTAAACSTTASTAKISLEGAIGRDESDALTVFVYAQDGTITGGTTLNNIWDHDATPGNPNADPVVPTPDATRFSAVSMEIAKAKIAGVGGGGDKRSTLDLVVTPASGKTQVKLYVFYTGNAPIPTADFDHDGVSGTDAVLQINQPADLRSENTLFGTDATSGTMTVTFLGAPSVGKDSDNDKVVDDVNKCLPGADRADDASNPATNPGNEAACTNVDPKDTFHAKESRSKLVVRPSTGEGSNDFADATTTIVTGGESKDRVVTTNADLAVYVVVEDAAGRSLVGEEVTYTVSSVPKNNGPNYERDADVLEAVTSTTAGKILVAGAGSPATASAAATATITTGDAVAMRTIRDLTGTSYQVTVKVTIGNTDLGTVVIRRAGAPATLETGTYNSQCIDPGATDAVTDDKFDMSRKDCAADMRFGRKQTFAVMTEVKDSQGTPTSGDAAKWKISGATDAVTMQARNSGDDMFYVFTVKDDAPLGQHTLTVTHASDDVADATLDFTVAGPPSEYETDPASPLYTMSRRITVKVTAVDENGGVPHFTTTDDSTTDKDERDHRVLIDALDGVVRGVETDDYLVLDTDTGEKSFTLTLPRDVSAGEEFDIYIGQGTMQETLLVIYGAAPMAPGTPTGVTATADSHEAITVGWKAPTTGDPATGYTVQQQGAMDDTGAATWMDVTRCVDISAMTCTVSGLMASTAYTFQVRAMNATGNSDYVAADSVMTMAKTPPALSGTTLSVDTITAGSSAEVDASGAFTMTEGDAITMYNATSSDSAVATATVDADGTVTITGVSAGPATISVTATDMDGTSDPVTIAVTVEVGALMAPTDVTAVSRLGFVIVDWTPGRGADGHAVVLFTADNEYVDGNALLSGDATRYAFNNVASGDYYVIVASYRGAEFKYDFLGTDVTVQ